MEKDEEEGREGEKKEGEGVKEGEEKRGGWKGREEKIVITWWEESLEGD
jgi:hypothetical protein